jgi:hypothetical protein
LRRTPRTGYSYLGIALFVVSFGAALLLAVLVLLALLFMSIGIDPPGDEVAYGFMVVMLVLGITLSEVVALVLGIVGVFQRRRRRLSAVLGIACSLLTLIVVFCIVWFTQ